MINESVGISPVGTDNTNLNVSIGSRYKCILQSTPSLWWYTISLLDRRSEQPESFVFDVDEVFSNSYERCLKTGGLIDLFYEKYIASNEIVAQKFARVDIAEQKAALDAGLHKIMALRSAQPEKLAAYFRGIGNTHSRKQYDISPELYDLWLRCLLEAVEECDDQYDSQVEDAWNEILSDGIRIMKSMY